MSCICAAYPSTSRAARTLGLRVLATGGTGVACLHACRDRPRGLSLRSHASAPAGCSWLYDYERRMATLSDQAGPLHQVPEGYQTSGTETSPLRGPGLYSKASRYSVAPALLW